MFAGVHPHDALVAVRVSVAAADRVELHRAETVTAADRKSLGVQLADLTHGTVVTVARICLKNGSYFVYWCGERTGGCACGMVN